MQFICNRQASQCIRKCTEFTRISAAALINSPTPNAVLEVGTYSSNYCNWQLKSLLHLGKIVITFRTKCYYI